MRFAPLSCLLGLAVAPLAAQQRPALTAADYSRAEQFLGYSANPLVFGTGIRPSWLPDGRPGTATAFRGAAS
jgi:hypothetical protein